MTPRSFILMKAFWFYGSFSEAMSFSKFATSVSKVTIDYRKFSIVWLPQVKCLLLLWKTKTAWIKRSIHYVTLQCYNPGKALEEIPPYLDGDFWYKRRKKKIENDMASIFSFSSSLEFVLMIIVLIVFIYSIKNKRNGSRIKTPSSKSLILVSFLLEKEFSRHLCTH